MPRKRHTPEDVLGAIVPGLEQDSPPEAQYDALWLLLMQGPYVVPLPVLQQLDATEATGDTLARAELLQILRALAGYVVLDSDGQPQRVATQSAPFTVYGPAHWVAVTNTAGHMVFQLDGDLRDVLVMQLIGLLQTVGLDRIRRCPARAAGSPLQPCGRLFAKVGRRQFCSRACQNRAHMQQDRENRKRARAQRARARRRQGRTG